MPTKYIGFKWLAYVYCKPFSNLCIFALFCCICKLRTFVLIIIIIIVTIIVLIIIGETKLYFYSKPQYCYTYICEFELLNLDVTS